MSKKKQRHRTQAKMFPLVEAYIKSSGSRAAFCAAHGLPISALNYWQTKYRKAHGLPMGEKRRVSRKSSGKQGGFVELSAPAAAVQPERLAGPLMEAELGSGAVLRFFSWPEAGYLRALLSEEKC